MKWLLLMGAVAFGAFAVWWLARGRPGRPVRSRTLAEGALAILSLVLIVAAAYVAHGMGIFSLPLVALAFLPFGVATRWLLVSTRETRGRRTLDGRTPVAGPWVRFALPLMAATLKAGAVAGVVVGAWIGPH